MILMPDNNKWKEKGNEKQLREENALISPCILTRKSFCAPTIRHLFPHNVTISLDLRIPWLRISMRINKPSPDFWYICSYQERERDVHRCGKLVTSLDDLYNVCVSLMRLTCSMRLSFRWVGNNFCSVYDYSFHSCCCGNALGDINP